MYRKLTIFALVTALGVLAFAGVSSAATVKGKVVHKNKSAKSFTVAKGSGQLISVHAERSPGLGRTVVVQGSLLHNGTFGADKITVGAASKRACVHGVVTFVNGGHTKFTVSGKGVSLVVRKHALGKVPAVGTVVTINGSFTKQGDIAADDCRDCGTNDGYVELEGHILEVDSEARTLTLSADDDCELPGTITLVIPASWDMARYVVGHELEVVATLNADAVSYTAVGTSEDCDRHEADDEDCEEGDNYADIEGDVVSVDESGGTLTMSVDDDDAMRGDTVTVIIPDTVMDIADLAVGDELEIIATRNDNGTYTAVQIEHDDADSDCGDDDCDDDPGCDSDDCGDDPGCDSDDCDDD
jgi:hypothetical protein